MNPVRIAVEVDVGEIWQLSSQQVIFQVHFEEKCVGDCPLHSPSDHSMRSFQLLWRDDRRIFERICPHGVGHPDPDWLRGKPAHEGIHGCDGCCRAD